DHQGYNGRTTAELNDRVDTYLDADDPQIILLHIGTNDISKSGYNVTNSTNNIESILDKIYTHNNNIKVILARIINRKTDNPNTTAFNDSVVAMANGHIADIDIVDMEDSAGIDYTADMEDNLHPNNTGYTKMADLWYSALKTVIPMHLWKLEEATGSTTYLDSYRGANGTCTGDGCPIATIGKTGNAQEFNGIDEKIDVTDTATFDWAVTDSFTIEFWMKANPSADNTWEVMIGRKGSGTSDNDRWYVGINRDSGKITYGLGNSNGENDEGIGDSVVDGSNGIDWNHIAYVVTSDKILLYVNGVVDINRTRTYPDTEHIQGTPVNIGYLNLGNGFEYTGLLDEVDVYDDALSAAQIKKHYQRYQMVNEIIVDNLDPEFSTTGTWSESSAPDEYDGSSLYSKTLNSSATWRPVLPEAGSYYVYVWYSGSSSHSRDPEAEYTVNHAGGSETIVIDQSQGSGDWVLLGDFSFDVGSSGNVVLSRDIGSTSISTSADAVKFEYLPGGSVNDSPVVDAGSDKTITLPAGTSFDGTVTDDGLPAPYTVQWTKVSGPGTVTFSDSNAEDTTASFSEEGTYVLRLTADDTELQGYDDVEITVNPAGSSSEIIVDNRDSGFSTTGTWSESSAPDEYDGSSLYSKTLNSSATWRPVLPEAGSYYVYVWYSGSSSHSRDPEAEYTVNHAGGSETIVIDQSQGSGDWVLLGDFSFDVGSSGNVVLSRDIGSTSISTSADAVKFAPV
ncbi:LamG-like jellyroll fold domain-containing protein, partial [Campylobacterota bacterium]